MGLRRPSRQARLGAESRGQSHTRSRAFLAKSLSHSFDFESSSKAVKHSSETRYRTYSFNTKSIERDKDKINEVGQ